ncbi:ICOS ligand-like isoform 2-T2 [Aulostomus maculatus]
MRVALWRTGLLLCLLGVCACVEECVLGIVGQPVSLPCFHADPFPFVNYSIEWRRDGEVVLRSVWVQAANVDTWSFNSVAMSADAPLTGNFSLELPTAEPREGTVHYSLSVRSQGNQSVQLCSVCLQTAAGFSSPLLQREAAAQGNQSVFVCHSSGGFPEPAVYWLIDDVHEPPEGSVRTLITPLPDSHLYNITSYLTLNLSSDSRVSCFIENVPMNSTLSSTDNGRQDSPVVGRASEAMWMFSTALCVVVGVMVAVGVAYQIHLDRGTEDNICRGKMR